MYKLLTDAGNYRDPYSHALKGDAMAATRKILLDHGCTDVSVVQRKVMWSHMLDERTTYIQELVFDIERDKLHALQDALLYSEGAPLRMQHFGVVAWHPKADEIIKLLNDHHFPAELEDGEIRFESRDDGDVGSETPGARDWARAEKAKALLNAAYPKLPVTIESADEWVCLSVRLADLPVDKIKESPKAAKRPRG